MKRVAVTGANGFVGAAVCRELVNQNCDVIAIVRSRDSDISRISSLPLKEIVYCEMSEYGSLPQLVQSSGIDTLYHFAWNGSAGAGRGRYNTQCDDIVSTCELVEACAQMKIRRFVFASSIMEYEIQKAMEGEQDASINTLYSSAKIAANYMARSIADHCGIEYIRGVISNIYGPGELSPRLVNTTIRKLMKGEHCSFSPGDQMYDFIYVTDAAKEFVAVGKKGIHNRTYYIGSLEPKPLKEFLQDIRNVVDPEAQLGLGEIPFNGVSLQYNEFDLLAVKKDTGFVPETSFKQGIRNTMDWLKEVNRGTV